MRYGEENIDLLLFDYLEGNLSDGQHNELEREILTDSSLSEEMEIWKTARVECEFFDTQQLEASILKNIKPTISFIHYLNIILFTSLVFISGIQKESMTYPFPDVVENRAIVSNEKPVFKPFPEVNNISPNTPVAEKLDLPVIDINPLALSEEKWIRHKRLTYLSVDNIPVQFQPIITLPEAIAIRPPLAKKEVSLDRKAYKKLQRHRRKNNAKSGFIKGDVPYVVPMDPKNFY